MIYKHLSLHSKEANPQESIAKQTNPPYCYSYSPFLRVSTPIASNHSGFYHTPRVGDEVIISYMDNDIDKPYISGSLYNLTNPSLAHLPIQDHITTLSSKTIGVNEQGRNEITLSNEKNKEVITLKAQKDYTQSINNNFSQTIHNNKDSITLGNYTESIHKTHSQNITLTKSVKVGGEYLTNVTLSKDTLVGLSNSLNVGGDNTLRVGKDSSESVGEDKRVEIGGNNNTTIEKDSQMIIKGNSETIIEGDNDIVINKKLNIQTQGEIAIHSNENIHLSSPQSLSLESETAAIMVADNVTMIADSHYT
ncbi:bacteriophage T4 gp5 trimerisation domain-containing protein, partial [Helicobacter cinaedi]